AGDVDVFQFAFAADVVDLAFTSFAEEQIERTAVVFNVDPVAHLPSVSVYRQMLARERPGDHQGNEFLGKLKRAIVIGAAGDNCGKAVGFDGRQEQEVGRR